MLDAVIARLKAEVADFEGRVEGAARFAEMVRSKRLGGAPVQAYVMPLGLIGGQADAMSGAFTQMLTETVGVVIAVRSADPRGKRALDEFDTLKSGVIAALAGWAPDDAVGPFEVKRGATLAAAGDAFFYQLDFAINDQLRILS